MGTFVNRHPKVGLPEHLGLSLHQVERLYRAYRAGGGAAMVYAMNTK